MTTSKTIFFFSVYIGYLYILFFFSYEYHHAAQEHCSINCAYSHIRACGHSAKPIVPKNPSNSFSAWWYKILQWWRRECEIGEFKTRITRSLHFSHRSPKDSLLLSLSSDGNWTEYSSSETFVAEVSSVPVFERWFSINISHFLVTWIFVFSILHTWIHVSEGIWRNTRTSTYFELFYVSFLRAFSRYSLHFPTRLEVHHTCVFERWCWCLNILMVYYWECFVFGYFW